MCRCFKVYNKNQLRRDRQGSGGRRLKNRRVEKKTTIGLTRSRKGLTRSRKKKY
jgi:hypothetical protein